MLPYVFKVAPKDSDAAKRIYKTMKAKGITKIGAISSNDGFGKGGKAQLDKYAKENGNHRGHLRSVRQERHGPDRYSDQVERPADSGGGELVDRPGPCRW